MKTNFPNPTITARETAVEGSQYFIVNIAGLDAKLNAARRFSDPQKAMRYMFYLSKRLNLRIDRVDLLAMSLECQRAKARAAGSSTADDTAAADAAPLDAENDNTPDGSDRKSMFEAYHTLKERNNNALLLFNTQGGYVLLNEDATAAGAILSLDAVSGDMGSELVFGAELLDTYLPKLIRAGRRVAVVKRGEA